MPGFLGRSIAMTWGGSAIGGVREKKPALSGPAVDLTSDEDNGWRTLHDVAGQNEVNLSLSGISKVATLRNDWFAGNRTKPVVLTYPDGSILSGTFYLANYNETGAYNDAVTFDCELQSTGVVNLTPGS